MEESESEVRAGGLPGFQNFDPLTAAGSDNWRLVKEILVAYGSQSMDAALDEQETKQLWEEIEITNVRESTAPERAAFKVWKRADGSVSDQTTVENMKLRFSQQMDAGYQAYVLSEDTHGRHDPQLEKQWAKFRVVLRRARRAGNTKIRWMCRCGSSRQEFSSSLSAQHSTNGSRSQDSSTTTDYSNRWRQ